MAYDNQMLLDNSIIYTTLTRQNHPSYYHISFYTLFYLLFSFFFSSRRRHTRCLSDWSSDVCSSDLAAASPRCYRRHAREAVAAAEGSATRGAVARRKLHGARRFRLPDRDALGRYAGGWRHHHLGRLALRHRRQAERAAAPLQVAAPHLGRPRVGRRDARGGRDRLPLHNGSRRDRR